MQGDQLAQEIKRRKPSQKIIMVTAFPPATPPAGCERVLVKPFAIAELSRVVGN